MGDEFAFLYLTPNGECLPYVERVSCGWSIIKTRNGEGSKWRLQPAARAEKQTSSKDCCSTQFFFWVVLRVWVMQLGKIKYIFGARYVPVVEVTIMNIFLGFFIAYTQTYKEK